MDLHTLTDTKKEKKLTRASGPNSRYFVPDLSPEGQKLLAKMNPRFLFIAESPHVNEVESDDIKERRPLCGMAGRKWWSLLSLLLEGVENADVSLEHQLDFCKKHEIAVL